MATMLWASWKDREHDLAKLAALLQDSSMIIKLNSALPRLMVSRCPSAVANSGSKHNDRIDMPSAVETSRLARHIFQTTRTSTFHQYISRS